MRIASGATARLLGCMLIGLTQGVSLAQINQGPTAPGQIEREFQRPPVAPQPQPPVAPVIEQQAPPPGADKVRFTLRELSVEGATVYKPSDLKPYYARYVGKEISLADVYAIAAALTNKYRNDGYVLSQVVVAAQTIDNGTVQLRRSRATSRKWRWTARSWVHDRPSTSSWTTSSRCGRSLQQR